MGPNAFTGSPGYFTWNSILFQLMDENWETNVEIVTVERSTNLQGVIGRWEQYVKSTVTAKPIAFLASLAAQIGVLLPYLPSMRGQRIRGSSDLPLVIQTADGRSITFSSAVLTKMPPVQFAPNKDFWGAAEFTCLRKANTAATDATAHVVEASSAYTAPALDPDDIVSSKYTLAFGSTPFDNIECDEDGVTFEPQVTLKELPTWNEGVLNFQIDKVMAAIKFKPQNLSGANLLNTLVLTDGSSAGRGKRLGARGLALTVTGAAVGDPLLTVPLAVAATGKMHFGSANRVGEVALMAEQKNVSGAFAALFTLDVVPTP